jgi:hypothetical protein
MMLPSRPESNAKKQALVQVMERVRAIAAERNETVASEIEAQVAGRATEIWSAAK